MSKFKETNKRMEAAVADGYKKIEAGVVEGYQKIEAGAVGGYKKIEDKFIETFLTKEGESVEAARARLTGREETK